MDEVVFAVCGAERDGRNGLVYNSNLSTQEKCVTVPCCTNRASNGNGGCSVFCVTTDGIKIGMSSASVMDFSLYDC